MKKLSYSALLLASSVALGAVPGDLVVGKWVPISVPSGTGSTMVSVSGQDATTLGGIMAYSSAVFASGYGASGSLIVFGGGHGDYNKNDTYAFDVATGLWSRVTAPSTGSCNRATSQYPDGRPCSAHTYDYLEYSPTTNELFKMGSASEDGQAGPGTGAVHALNLSGIPSWRTGTRLTAFVDGTAAAEGATSAWDSLNQVLWWHAAFRFGSTTNNLQKYNPVTNVVSTYAGRNANKDGGLAFAPELKALIFLDIQTNQALHTWDVTTGTPVRISPSTTGTWPSPQAGFEWDPIALKGVAYSGGTNIKTLTPTANWLTTHSTAAWAWDTPAVTSGSAVPVDTVGKTSGQYGRFRYVPALCGFIYVGGVNAPVYAYRLTGGAGPGCGGTPPTDPPPAVSLTSSALSINPGDSVTLTWNSSNATGCTASASPTFSGWTGSKTTSGSLPVGPLTVTTTFTFSCNGLLSQSATVATNTPPLTVIVNTGTGGTGDFAERCAAPGVVRCTGFDTDADFSPSVAFPNPAGVGPVRDTAVKASGASSLRFTVPSGSSENVAGYWLDNTWDETYVHPVDGLVGGVDTDHFKPGETFYMQYRQRMDSQYRNYDWATNVGSYPKHWILHPIDQPSCTTTQLVMVRRYSQTFPFMYASCGAPTIQVDLPGPGTDYHIQQGDGQPGGVANCTYQLTKTGTSDCKLYTADNWTTYYYKFTLGTFGTPTTRIEGWMGDDGQPPVKIFSKLDHVLDCAVSTNDPVTQCVGEDDAFSAIQLTTYMTNKNGNAHPVASTWYDELIFSTGPIPWPSGGSANPVPTATLTATPTTVAAGGITSLDWSSTNANSCTASGAWAGALGSSGTQDSDPLTVGATFTIVCTGAGGTSTPVSVNVGVTNAPPVVTIDRSPVSVPAGSGSMITWSSTGATTCTSSGTGWASGTRATSGQQFSYALSATTTFTITCTGAGGTTPASTTVNVTTPQPVIDTFTASPNPVDYGASSTLTWTSTDATSCGFTAPFIISVAVDGTTQVQLTTATTVTLRCQNALGSTSQSILIGVNPIPNATVTLTPVNPTITSGDSQLLTWTTTNANACTGTPVGAWSAAVAAAPGGGSLSVSPTTTTAYSVTCTAAAGASASDSTQVIVNSAVVDPVVELVPAAGQIVSGNSTNLVWQVSDATSCTATGDWSGAKNPVSGVESTGVLAASKTYTLTCTNAGGGTGADTAQVIVTAAPVPPATNITASPSTINAGDPVVVTWNCTNSTSAVPSGGGSDPDWLSATSLSGSRTLYPTTTRNYTMTCTDEVTPDVEFATVTVNAARTLSLTASPAAAFTNGSTTLTWATGGVLDVCIWLKGPYTNQIVAADGSVTSGTLTVPTEFEILCGLSSELVVGLSPDFRNNPNLKIQSITVNVTPNTPRKHRRRWWRIRR